MKSVFSVLKPYEFDGEVYKVLAENIYSDYEKKVKREPADMVSCFESLEDQNTAAAVFAVKPDFEDMTKTEKAITENVRLIKKNYTDRLLAEAQTVEDIMQLAKEKKKLDELNIIVSEGLEK